MKRRRGELLELVLGEIITQHAGDGKPFLQFFELDHGADFATSVNGMPVNIPTNAHGQGDCGARSSAVHILGYRYYFRFRRGNNSYCRCNILLKSGKTA